MALQRMSETYSQLLNYLQPILSDPEKYRNVWLGLGTVGLTLLYLAYRRKHQKKVKLVSRVDLNHQSDVLEGAERIHVCAWPQTGEKLLIDDEFTTLYDLFLNGHKQDKNADCLGYRPGPNQPYKWYSYDEVLQKAIATGAGLLRLGLKPGSDNFLAIYAINCPEWVMSCIGCMSQSIPIVPLYDTLGAEASAFIINQAEISVVVCDTQDKAEKLLESRDKTPSLRHIVLIKPFSPELSAKGQAVGVEIHSFRHIVDLGVNNPTELRLPYADDLYIICYTSGTTGNPKGVMLSHRNVVTNVAAGARMFNLCGLHFELGDTVISYLPMAHMFEQMVEMYSFYYGIRIGFYQGNVKTLLDDMKVLRPTHFPVVPRLMNRLYDKVQGGVSQSWFKSTLFKWGFEAKLAELKRGIYRTDSIWDRLIFNRIRSELGGRIRALFTGSAPVSSDVLNFCRVALNSHIFEGYGQTECGAIATITLAGDFEGGHVGGPASCAQVKLVDVPELNYFSAEDKGEICVKGPSVTKGYFKDPEKTAEVIDADGWLHTGDVGMWLPNGTLRVFDRIKNIFKLAQGEYVAPEKIENIYLRSPLVGQIFVEGNSLQRFLVAIVVPEESELRYFASSRLDESWVESASFADLCASRQLRNLVLEDLTFVGKANKLSSIELVRAIHLTHEPFTMENGLLTPTMKAKRPQLRKFYQETVDQLYRETKLPGDN